ncbi:hypothetical protein KQX54_009603 [Cotesia glomerata]|uniref:Uncharacterized protein n=1 Tax=Cotesia glomerata TaxID=32391 RepID=A0AAV7IDZ6_COTGL|nr:hypothetical protein KQX54_009603 [Cotesia glomerata]
MKKGNTGWVGVYVGKPKLNEQKCLFVIARIRNTNDSTRGNLTLSSLVVILACAFCYNSGLVPPDDPDAKVADSSEETDSSRVNNVSPNNTDSTSQENSSKKESEKDTEIPIILLDPHPNISANSASTAKTTEPTAKATEPTAKTTEPTAKTTESTQLEVKEKSSEDIPWALDDTVLEIMGAEPATNEPQLVLHSSVTNRWKKYITDGLKKEDKESLLKKYPRSGKFSLEPPILNDKVSESLKESAVKRDTYFYWTQKLAGSDLLALSPVIESLATSKAPEDVKRLDNVWAASKMLIEIHRSQTVARKACILPNLSNTEKKNFVLAT